MEEFTTIEEQKLEEIVEKKSKFIANIYYINTQEEAEEIIKKIKKKYYDARHNCYAYRVIHKNGIIEKASDDGEPSGTAGAPMLSILQKNNICNNLIIVTRYFGGILLGTGGLVRSYSEACLKVIENSKKIVKCKGIEVEVKVDYSNLELFKYYCRINKINIIKIQYNEEICINIEMELAKKEKFLDDVKNQILFVKNFNILGLKLINKV